MGLVADEAVKGNDGTILRGADVADEIGHVNGLAQQLKNVIVERRWHVDALAATHGREECDLVAGMERRIPRSEFLIARGNDRRTIFGKLGMRCGVVGEEMFYRGRFGKFGRIFVAADELFEAAEEENLDADRL